MTRLIQTHSRALRVTAALLAVPLALSPVLSTPAAAQWIVYDPTNYAQNVLTAARTLQQVNQQITQLQNEAQMLINQARNLASLPHSSLQQLQQSVHPSVGRCNTPMTRPAEPRHCDLSTQPADADAQDQHQCC